MESCFSDAAAFLRHELEGHHRYQPLRRLKAGSFGTVALAEDRVAGSRVALKFTPRCQVGASGCAEAELLNHLKLQHPHVISLHEVFLTEDNLVLVLEYAAGADLASRIPKGGLPEQEARWIFLQVLFALDYCHRLGVASRDIKLENILLCGASWSAKPIVKLCDFGLSHDCTQPCHDCVGTPTYMAPELVSNAGGQLPYDAKKADVWSCGVLLYAMLTGQSAFQRATDLQLSSVEQLKALFERIITADCPMPSNLSEGCRDLLSRMLTVDPARRPSISELMAHPWCCTDRISGAAMLKCNDVLVAQRLANPTPPEVLLEVHSILEEAFLSPNTPCTASSMARMASSDSDAGPAPP